jgi:hypothetical protein
MSRLRGESAAALFLLAACTSAARSARAADEKPEGGANGTRAEATAADNKSGAAALFAEAGRLIDAGQTAAACSKYEESLRLYDGMSTRYFLADCDERLGKMASAWGMFLEVAARARAIGDAAKEAKALERAAAVTGRVSHVVVMIEGGPERAGLEVRRDGAVLGRGEWGQALPVDPGEHVFEASEPAKRPWTARLVVAGGGENATVVVPALEDRPRYAPPGLGVPASDGGRERQRIAGAALGGLGLVGLGVSTALAIGAKARFNEAGADCNGDRCTQDGVNIRADAGRRANVASVVFGAGIVALVGGGALWFTAPHGASVSGGPTALWFGPTLGGAAVRGEF